MLWRFRGRGSLQRVPDEQGPARRIIWRTALPFKLIKHSMMLNMPQLNEHSCTQDAF